MSLFLLCLKTRNFAPYYIYYLKIKAEKRENKGSNQGP